MRTVLALVAVAFCIAGSALLACGASVAKVEPSPAPEAGVPTPPDDPKVAGNVPCDVAKILSEKCGACHSATPEFGAPNPLVTMSDLYRVAKSDPSRKLYELVAARVANDERPMPPYPNARLAESDRAILAAWAAAGAPPSTSAADCSTKPPVVDPGVSCKPDLAIGPATPFAMQASAGDEYVCYGVELSRPTPTHVTALAPRIDNTKIVHHVVLFESEQAYSSTPTPCNAGGSVQWRMLTAWAPGGKGMELPPAAGFPLKTDGAGKTHYVVQMHYSNPQALTGQVDQSGFDLCTAPPRQYEADVLAFGTQNIDIPAGAAAYERTCSITVPQQLAGIHLFAVMPHMHKLGTAMKTELLAGGPTGASSDLGEVKAFSFDTQAWQSIQGLPGETGVVTKTNDVIKTRCQWKNTTGAPVKFGENTADEMCYSFTVYYPKIASPVWSWATPSFTSQCQ